MNKHEKENEMVNDDKTENDKEEENDEENCDEEEHTALNENINIEAQDVEQDDMANRTFNNPSQS